MSNTSIYLTPWSGKPILKEWTRRITSGNMSGTQYWVRYVDKRGKEIDFMKWVVWDKGV